MSDDAGELVLNTSVDLDGLDEGLKDVEKKAEKSGEESGSLFGDGLQTALLGAIAVVTTALAGIGIAAVDVAGQSNKAFNDLKKELGATDEEAAKLHDTTIELFGNNLGDSIEDVNDAVITTRKQIKGLADEDLAAVTESALRIRDTFEVDVADSTNTINTLMTEFGLTATEATDLYVDGLQSGLDNSGDLKDTIGEYAVQFKQAGFSGEEFFSMLKTGQQGGVLGTDKIADAIKEMGIRLNEGTDDAKAAFTAIGLDYDKIAASVAAGDETWADYFDQIQGGLGGLEDPLARSQAGVAIFGTQWEDAGSDAILAMDATKFGMADIAGATASLNTGYTDLGSMFSGTWRMVQTEILLPIGNKLLELANTVMPYVKMAIEGISAALSGEGGGLGAIVGNIGTIVANLLPTIVDALGDILNGMIAWVTANVPIWIEALGTFGQAAIQWVADALPPLLAQLATVAQSLIGWVMEQLPVWATALLELGTKLVNWALDALPGLITNLGTVVKGMLQWVLDSLPGWGEELGKLGAKLIDWVSDSLPGLGTKLGTVLRTLLGWIGQTIIDVAPELLKLAWSFLSWIVTDVVPALPGKLLEIATAVIGFIGGLIKSLAPELLKVAGEFLDWVADDVLPTLPEKLGQIWTAISGWIGGILEDVGTAAGDIGQALLDGIASVVNGGIDIVVGAARTIINPIIGFLNSVIDGANAVSDVFGGDPIPPIPELAGGTNFWKGGLAMVSEPWLGPEWATVPGQGSGFLAPGAQNLPRGTEVLSARESAGMGAGQGGGTQIIQQFDAGVTEEGVYRKAREAAEDALRATATDGYLYQQTGGFN